MDTEILLNEFDDFNNEENIIEPFTDNYYKLKKWLTTTGGQIETLVSGKIADVIKKEAEEWNITIHCKDIEESALFSSIARDQVKLFAEYIANFILDKEG